MSCLAPRPDTRPGGLWNALGASPACRGDACVARLPDCDAPFLDSLPDLPSRRPAVFKTRRLAVLPAGQLSMTDFSIEHGYADYSETELLEQAQENAQALILATASFVKQRGIPPADWAAAIGEVFARGWGEVRPWDAVSSSTPSSPICVPLAPKSSRRARRRSRRSDHSPLPDPELVDLLGVDPAPAGVFHDAITVIAEPRGLRWTWRREKDGVTRYIVERIVDDRVKRRPRSRSKPPAPAS